jgi:hypothetical protein
MLSLEMLGVTFTTSQCSLAYEFTQVDKNNGITIPTISPAWTTDAILCEKHTGTIAKEIALKQLVAGTIFHKSRCDNCPVPETDTQLNPCTCQPIHCYFKPH